MGELLSSRIIAAALVNAGLPGEWVDARRAIVTDDEHTKAAPLMRETTAALRASVAAARRRAARSRWSAGFVGATVDGHTTTLGRGGSDYSGAIVGAGIDASEIQIWTDVDGMLTADPRVIPQSRLVPRLSFAEAAELSYPRRLRAIRKRVADRGNGFRNADGKDLRRRHRRTGGHRPPGRLRTPSAPAPTPSRGRRPSPSCCRRRTSPAACTWAMPSTTR